MNRLNKSLGQNSLRCAPWNSDEGIRPLEICDFGEERRGKRDPAAGISPLEICDLSRQMEKGCLRIKNVILKIS